jgi:hypothetical protein
MIPAEIVSRRQVAIALAGDALDRRRTAPKSYNKIRSGSAMAKLPEQARIRC